MAEEVTYADLSFHSSLRDAGRYGTVNTDLHKEENLEKATAVPRRSSLMTCIIILLGILCILLLILSVTLGVLYAELLEKVNTSLEDTVPERSNGHFPQNEGQWYDFCPEGWRPWKGKCYFVSTEKREWRLSLQDCASKGSQLALLKNPTDLILINISGNNEFWVGLRRIDSTWMWFDGSLLSSSTTDLWTCAVLTTNGLYRQRCVSQQHWICEKSIIKLQLEQNCSLQTLLVNGVKHVDIPKENA